MCGLKGVSQRTSHVVHQYASGTLKERVKKSLLKALQQDKYDFEMEGVRLCDFRAALLDTLTCSTQLEEAQSQLVLQVARTAEKQQLSQEQLQYKQWVEAACEGGVKGLYKAIKSPETNLLRPYRDKFQGQIPGNTTSSAKS